MKGHAFHDYNVAFNFCRFRALAYTTLDNLRAVFFYLILYTGYSAPELVQFDRFSDHARNYLSALPRINVTISIYPLTSYCLFRTV